MAGSTEWRTPPEFFATLHAEFNFNVDAAATAENALVKPICREGGPLPGGTWREDGDCWLCHKPIGRYYTAETDGTKREHYGPGDRVYANPPYAAKVCDRFVETAALTSREQGALWVVLLNATTTDSERFHRWIWDRELHRPRDRVELRLLPGRIRFYGELGTPIPNPRYSNMLVIFRPPLEPGL